MNHPRYTAWVAWMGLIGLALAWPALARAQSFAFTVNATPVYAGPDWDYPEVARLPPGVQVAVYGCTEGLEWCDVGFDRVRGWADGGRLEVNLDGQVVIVQQAPRWWFPLTVFSLEAYWGDHYRYQSWYPTWPRYRNHLPAYPPRPPIYQGRPYHPYDRDDQDRRDGDEDHHDRREWPNSPEDRRDHHAWPGDRDRSLPPPVRALPARPPMPNQINPQKSSDRHTDHESQVDRHHHDQNNDGNRHN